VQKEDTAVALALPFPSEIKESRWPVLFLLVDDGLACSFWALPSASIEGNLISLSPNPLYLVAFR
jgi:hypothetical protein